MSAEVIDLQAARGERMETYEAPMMRVTTSDYHFGISEVGGERYAIVMRKDGAGYGLALTESEARQFAREILETANVMREQRVRQEGTPT